MIDDTDTAARKSMGQAFKEARIEIGHRWGLGRGLTREEMARALGLAGAKPTDTVWDYERGKMPISGPIMRLVDAMLAGHRPEGTIR